MKLFLAFVLVAQMLLLTYMAVGLGWLVHDVHVICLSQTMNALTEERQHACNW